MIDTVELTDWTPVQQAGRGGCPIELMVRDKIIMRLQDGLLVARAKRVVRRRRPKSGPNDRAPPGAATLTHEADVILPAELWSSDQLGFSDFAFWTDGDQRVPDLATTDDDYDGDHTTYYGIELRDVLDLSGSRAGNEEVVSWCVDWLARRRSAGLRTGENLAWPDFKSDTRHLGLSREDVFRPAFRLAKSGRV